MATDHQGVSAMLGVWLRDSLISLMMPILSSAARGGKDEEEIAKKEYEGLRIPRLCKNRRPAPEDEPGEDLERREASRRWSRAPACACRPDSFGPI